MNRSTSASDPAGWPPTRQIVGEYLAEFQQLLQRIDVDAVGRAVDLLRQARDRAATVYLAGNGGSAATATHLANDLGKATKRSGRAAMRVLCLSDNVSWLTALANDEGYERVFSGQLENYAEKGDVLIVISASGSSPNLVAAVKLARVRGVATVGVLGFDGGKLKDLVDECLWLESAIGSYGPVETAHSLLCDLLTTCLIRDVVAAPGDTSPEDTSPEDPGTRDPGPEDREATDPEPGA